MEKDLNEAKSTTYFLTWLKETCEFLMPNNTLTTNKEFFDMIMPFLKNQNHVFQKFFQIQL